MFLKKKNSLLLLPIFLLAGCLHLGPNYERPDLNLPTEFKEDLGHWKVAEPNDESARGDWWKIYNDRELDHLQEQAVAENQDLRAALARVDEARSIARISRAEFFPDAVGTPNASRQRTSDTLSPGNFGGGRTFNHFSLPLDLSYEVDLWGRVRRSFEAARAEALASKADYENVLLALTAEVAGNYFSLRSTDAEIQLLQTTQELRTKALDLVDKRFNNGDTSELDVSRAKTELADVNIELIGLQRIRAEYEHALAVLLGKAPSQFSFTASPLDLTAPKIPGGLPSDLLERRPDIAEAERRLASENARIGIAKAAFFPVVRLTGRMGLESGSIEDLFDWTSRAWSIGPSISLPIFEGGRNLANYKRAQARYEEAVAHYRQQILVAFREVEDGLSGLRILAQQSTAITDAVNSSGRSAEIAQKRYHTGLESYLEVVDAERIYLQNQQRDVRNRGEQLVTSVRLIKALGGSWK
jgi:multidrug efflux system outer membrane protein